VRWEVSDGSSNASSNAGTPDDVFGTHTVGLFGTIGGWRTSRALSISMASAASSVARARCTGGLPGRAPARASIRIDPDRRQRHRPSHALKNRSYLEDLDLIVTQETELIALRQQAVVLADQSMRLTDCVNLLCSQCGASATARPAIRSNEPIVVRSGRGDAPLGRRSGLRSAGRPPSARLSPENDAHRAEHL
jgi:hypothetical protein